VLSFAEHQWEDPDAIFVDRDDAVGTAGLDYSQQVTKTTKLTNKLLVQSGVNDFAVAVNMTRTLVLSVGYGVRYNSALPTGTK